SGRRSSTPDAVDDPRRHLPIRLPAELEVLAPTRPRDGTERVAIERRANDAPTRTRACTVSRNRVEPGWDDTTAGRADTDHMNHDAPSTRTLERDCDVTAPRLTVGDDHKGFRIVALAKQLLVLFDEFESPPDRFFDVRIPGRIVCQGERRLGTQMIQEEEKRIRIPCEAQLRCRTVGKQREPYAIPPPTERVGKSANELNRSLPPIGRDVGNVHRCRAVLEDHDVRTGFAYYRDAGLRLGEHDDAQARSDYQKGPERQIAGERVSPTHRHHALSNAPPDVGGPAHDLPRPQQGQTGRYQEQPKVERLAKRQRAERGAHLQPLRFMGPALPACPPCSRSCDSSGTRIL